jgi:hypothetical protein
VARRRVTYWHEGMPVSPRRPVRRPWKEPAADDLPALPTVWTPLGGDAWTEWARQAVHSQRARAYGAGAYDWRRRRFFEQWATDQIDWADRKLRKGAPLRLIAIYAASERRDWRNFRVEPGHIIHIPSGRIHYDVHYRRRPVRRIRHDLLVETAARLIITHQHAKLDTHERVSDISTLARALGTSRETIRAALQQVPPSLWPRVGRPLKKSAR